MAARSAGVVVPLDERERASSDGVPVVEVRSLNRGFGTRLVLSDLSLTIAPGEIVALIGRSGSGKSTLLRALAGLDPGVSDSITVRGPVGVGFQDARLLPWKRVLDNVVLGLRVRGAGRGRARRVRGRLAGDALRRRGAACVAGAGAGP